MACSAAICLGVPPNADTVTPALLYEALRARGPVALSTWHYTQDNWLLSVIVPQLPLHAVLGTPAWLPALTGWLCFVGCCALCGLIARPICGAIPALSLSATLLFATPESLLPWGSLAHPVSHDSTVLWCLAGLVPALAVLRGGRGWLAWPTAIALLVATISDPWAKPAFLLPVLLASCAMALAADGRRDRRAALCIAAATLPAWAAGSHAFGLLPALEASHFGPAGLAGAPARLGAGLHGIGLLLGIVPGAAASRHAVWWLSVAALALLTGLGVRAVLHRGRPSPDRLFLSLTCLLSAAATLMAYTLSSLPTDPSMARMLMNVFFVMPVFMVTTLAASATGRAVLGVASLLFVATGLAAEQARPPAPRPDREDRMIGFLQDHGLAYGYGSYWGSNANAIAIRSGQRVTLRPVTSPDGIAPIQPRFAQAFDDWFAPSDGPAAMAERFVVLSPDSELCADRAACARLAVRSFGPPSRVLDWEGTDIMVWPHPILFSPPGPAVLRGVPMLADGTLEGAALAATLWTGWTVPSGPDAGVWTTGERSVLMLRLEAAPRALCLRLRASGRAGSLAQAVSVMQGEEPVAHWGIEAGAARDYCTTLAAGGGELLALVRPRPAHGDTRLLPGLRLSRVSVAPVR